ncbi:MAG: aminodeoxychorismate/anthranilate synthase component II [Planctomycetota bacterium]
MILLIDNYDSFTWNLVQRLGELDPTLEPDRDLVVVRNDQITPDEARKLDGGKGPTHVIVSPGPCTPREAGVSGAIIETFSGRVPVLGVCLGHQALADLHGLPVVRHREPVHGKASRVHHDGLGLFTGLSQPFEAARYHSLVVPDSAVPDNESWQISAWTFEELDDGRVERLVMGLRRPGIGAAQAVEGVQFHPESFMTAEGPRLLANFLRSGPGKRHVSEARIAAIGTG